MFLTATRALRNNVNVHLILRRLTISKHRLNKLHTIMSANHLKVTENYSIDGALSASDLQTLSEGGHFKSFLYLCTDAGQDQGYVGASSLLILLLSTPFLIITSSCLFLNSPGHPMASPASVNGLKRRSTSLSTHPMPPLRPRRMCTPCCLYTAKWSCHCCNCRSRS